MAALLLLRSLTDDETVELRRLAHGQQVDARLREGVRRPRKPGLASGSMPTSPKKRGDRQPL
jgi:hypothetical protein